MTSERIRRLEAIDFAWDGLAEIWSQMFKMLEDYKEENGDCLVPAKYQLNHKLSTWVKKQRQEYRLLQRGEESQMTSERIRRLEAIDFAWDAQAEICSQMFKMLEDYKEENGDCLVPAKYQLNHKLSTWVKKQRQQYRLLQRGEQSSMTSERIRRLEAIDFAWDGLAENWNQMFEELEEYRNENGDCLVPAKYQPNQKLSTWVKKQRQQYRLLQRGEQSSICCKEASNLQ